MSCATALASLPLDGYRLAARRKMVSGISALKFDVEVSEVQPERHLREIREIVRRASALPAGVKDRASAIFGVLAEAEAKIHRTTPEEVHFHEVGAVDSIIDIVGAAWGFERWNWARCWSRRCRWGPASPARSTASFRFPRPRPPSCSRDSRCGWAMDPPRW